MRGLDDRSRRSLSCWSVPQSFPLHFLKGVPLSDFTVTISKPNPPRPQSTLRTQQHFLSPNANHFCLTSDLRLPEFGCKLLPLPSRIDFEIQIARRFGKKKSDEAKIFDQGRGRRRELTSSFSKPPLMLERERGGEGEYTIFKLDACFCRC